TRRGRPRFASVCGAELRDAAYPIGQERAPRPVGARPRGDRTAGRGSARELTPLPVARRRDVQGFAVLRDGAARDLDALIRQNPGDLVVAQRLLGIFGRDELADLRAHGGRGLLAVLAREVAREEIAKLEDAARSVHVLAGRDARDGRLVHLDGLGDVPQHHRLHVLLAFLEKLRLALHDRHRDLEQRLVTDLEASDQPTRFLKLRAQHVVLVAAAERARVHLVDAELRRDRAVQLDDPAPVAAADEHVRDDVFRGRGMHRRARTRVARTDERESDLEVGVRRFQETFQRAELMLGDELEMLGGDRARELEAWRRGIELLELQEHAFADRPRAASDRIEALDSPEHLFDLFDGRNHVGLERLTNDVELVDEITVVVDRVDDRFADHSRAVVEALELELPQQMVAQGLVGAVRVLERRSRLVAARRLRRSRALDVFPFGFGDGDLVVVVGRVAARFELADLDRFAVERRRRLGFGRRGLVDLEHHVLIQRFLDLRLQLHDGQLQQTNRLLELRRHRELLAQPELKRRFEHVPELKRKPFPEIHLAHPWIGEYLARGAASHQLSVVQDIGIAADSKCLPNIVIRYQYSNSAL